MTRAAHFANTASGFGKALPSVDRYCQLLRYLRNIGRTRSRKSRRHRWRQFKRFFQITKASNKEARQLKRAP